MFKVGDKIRVKANLSNSEILELIRDYRMYDKTKEELLSGEYFRVLEDMGFELKCATKRRSTVKLPIGLFEKAILEEGEEL